jgi:hypothetical protein
MARRRRRSRMPKGFVSKAQWRYFFANPGLRARWAHKEAHKAQRRGGGKKVAYRKLPRHVRGRTRRR